MTLDRDYQRALAATAPEPKRLKRMTNRSAYARFLLNDLQGDKDGAVPIGEIDMIASVRSPYSYSPRWQVFYWPAKKAKVFIRETSHRRFDVFEVPAGLTIHRVGSDR